jgi:hypothetical protein
MATTDEPDTDDELCHVPDLRAAGITVRASDLDLSRPFTYQALCAAAESAYRRGFDQGVSASWEAFRSGAEGDRIDRWGDEVTMWRYRHPGTEKWVFPPEPPRGRKRIRYGVAGA